MKNNKKFIASGMAVALISSGAATASADEGEDVSALEVPALKESYSDSFPMGAAVEPEHLEGTQGEILEKHYNSLVAENVMKPISLQPEEGEFDWEEADKIVEFANENDMELRFHTLLWHEQVPDWFFLDEDGNEMVDETDPEQQEANKELLLQRIDTHIEAVMTRYKDDIDAWDVVNEVIDPEAENDEGLRESPWYQITGKEFIKTAFESARKYGGEDAQLYINDYNTNESPKKEYLYDLVTELQDEGVPIDGVGHQTHINVSWPETESIEDSIELFTGLGLDNQITELDMSVYPYPPSGEYKSYEEIPDEVLDQQAERYQDLFQSFTDLDDQISNVTFWGIADNHTWLDDQFEDQETPGKDAPFVFDVDYDVKPAYWALDETPSSPADLEDGAEAAESEDMEGGELPETSTNQLSYVIAGGLLTVFSLAGLLYRRKKIA